MSAGYAARLSEYPNKGVVGLPENFDSKRQVKTRISRLAQMIQDAKHVVILTGAGISTSAGIPDFRGPRGIWTLEAKQAKEKARKRKRGDSGTQSATPSATPAMNFEAAKPTVTHRAIAYLVQKEKCGQCNSEFFRDSDVGGMSFKPTGKQCDLCHGDLYDTLLDWEDPLPDEDLERSEKECEASDLVLCLGSSLRIEPAGSLPLLAKRFVIVNLQVTPKDDLADLIIRASVDEVMLEILEQIGFRTWQDEPSIPIERVWTPSTSKSIHSRP
eukprot:Nitzschia sp. Nitz4//scaffold3_size479765//362341//363258//NITZ4_000150-RA/size479765-processed-gene-1.253-mRNA-1//1//CDS//3329550908//5493//frame0